MEGEGDQFDEQREEEVEKIWNSWNEQSVATIFMDAQRINNVFASIKKQLDYLRDNHSKLNIDFQAFTSSFMAPSARKSEDSAHPTKTVLPSFSLANFATQDDMSLLRGEIESLREELRTRFDFEQRILKIEQVITTNNRELSHKMDVLSLQLSNNNLEMSQHHDEFISFQSDYQITLEGLNKLIEDKFTSLEVNDMTAQKENDLKLNQMKDIISIQELKVKQLEGKLNHSLETLAELNHTIDNFPKNHLEVIHQQLQELTTDKAERIELDAKADLILTLGKADQNDFLNLQGFTEELERRLIQTLSDTAEKMKTIEQKLDHRSDRIATWCLKQLRKELKAMNITENDHRDGTDIGKVRCLVCDQVTSQQKFVSDVVFGGPEFHQTLKGFHRGRSSSPPPAEQAQSPTRRERSPSNTNPANRGHSRLVSPGQSPYDPKYYANPHGNNYYDQQVEDPDYMADFKYRASSVDMTNMPGTIAYNATAPANSNAPVKLPPATKAGHSQSTPLIQITSVHHQDGNTLAHYGRQAPVTEPMDMTQYKDLDRFVAYFLSIAASNDLQCRRIGRKTVVGTQGNNNNQALFSRKGRPLSAPMKRSTISSGKLKPMGKLVRDEDAPTMEFD